MNGRIRNSLSDAFRDRRVLVTGHTGFKGSWLTEWLLQLGANVAGLALPPDAGQPLFGILQLAGRIDHVECDIRDAARIAAEIQRVRPEFIFHLAAQPLVRRSYADPLGTWTTNVIGTLNVLEAVRDVGHPVSVVAVTTDKVYKNNEWAFAYREVDELGGHDPYSASKAACEVAVASWRSSFATERGVRVATARAGNVLGGGDFAEDRIVPDCYRAWGASQAVVLRNAGSTRPWQHVLEPLSGYLRLAQHLDDEPENYLTACNFGPGAGGDRSVRELATILSSLAPGRGWIDQPPARAVHEARSLALSIDLARHELGWSPLLDFAETMRWVDRGYSAPPGRTAEIIREQIAEYDGRFSQR